ncbi:hypothetical protein BKA63DRAFT_491673 [Paraphoma chrysanthemicola]|nr:hypothetical protein BKA63DRAFT_491673 [Paraphoma chrysanthemicola]
MAGNLPADCKLIETASTEVEGPYMTLSHRWDSTRKPCVTNAMNIGQRKTKISAHELPPIFEEAIHFARRMGVRYLWIDSSCIVQGEGGDWGREAIMMDRVYTHSMLNLEGTVGDSSLLQPRDPAVIAPCVVETRTLAITSYSTLHLRSNTLGMPRTRSRRDVPSLSSPKETQSQSSTGFMQIYKRSYSEDSKLLEQEKRLSKWYTVLTTYGRSEVTVETDRLVAIAGVAVKFSSLLDDNWITGLWRKNLPATCSGFFCPDGSDASMIDVLDVQLTPLDPKIPLGRLINGTLRLRGTLYPMAMDPPDWTEEVAKRDVMRLPPKIYLTGLEKKKKTISGLEGSVLPKYSFKSHFHTCHLRADEPVAYPDPAVSCYLPIRKTVYKGTRLVAGLALKPTGRRGEYERLGRMDFGNEDCQLFEDGLEVQRKGEEGSGYRAHPPTMSPELYIEGEVGIFAMV